MFIGSMKLIALMFVIITLSTGCSSDRDNSKLAYISSRAGSEYQNTFEELRVGTLFDFNLNLLKADKTWVEILVEGYHDGERVEPFPITKLSYGFHPSEVANGKMGLGIINPPNSAPLFFLYSEGVRVGPHSADTELFGNDMVSWAYAIGKGTFSLDSGEEMVLAVCRGNSREIRSGYDYQHPDAIEEMIRENKTVLLLKIKVEEKSR